MYVTRVYNKNTIFLTESQTSFTIPNEIQSLSTFGTYVRRSTMGGSQKIREEVSNMARSKKRVHRRKTLGPMKQRSQFPVGNGYFAKRNRRNGQIMNVMSVKGKKFKRVRTES